MEDTENLNDSEKRQVLRGQLVLPRIQKRIAEDEELRDAVIQFVCGGRIILGGFEEAFSTAGDVIAHGGRGIAKLLAVLVEEVYSVGLANMGDQLEDLAAHVGQAQSGVSKFRDKVVDDAFWEGVRKDAAVRIDKFEDQIAATYEDKAA